MNLKRKSENFTLLVILVILFLSFLISNPILANGSSNLTIKPVEIQSIDRSWENLSLIYPDQFHNSSQVDEEINQVLTQVPEMIDIEIIGSCYDGKEIACLRITNEQNSVQKAKTLVVAHHHAREQITVEMALRFVLLLVNNYGLDEAITDFVDTQEIYVIPTLNPSGLDIVVNQENYWLRKNVIPFDDDGDGLIDEDGPDDVNGDGIISGTVVYTKDQDGLHYYTSYPEGIDNDGDGLINEDRVGRTDLNRNYATFWAEDTGWINDSNSDYYQGDEPFSEPETQVFRDFALQHKFAMAYSLHSGTNATYFLDNEYGQWPETTLYNQMIYDYSKILPSSFNSPGTIEYNSKAISQGVSGHWGSWMYYERGCKVPITFEMYGNSTSTDLLTTVEENDTHLIQEWFGIYENFSPSLSHIDLLWNELSPAFTYLLEQTPRLEVNAEIIKTNTSNGYEEATIQFSIKNKSPRLDTIENININYNSGKIIKEGVIIQNEELVIYSDVKIAIAMDRIMLERLYVGNNYTGFIQFVLFSKESNGLTIVEIVYVCIIMALPISSILFVLKKLFP